MRKRYMFLRAVNWKLSFLYQFRRFQNRNLQYTSQTLFARKRDFVHPYFSYEHESLQHCLSCNLRYMATFVVL